MKEKIKKLIIPILAVYSAVVSSYLLFQTLDIEIKINQKETSENKTNNKTNNEELKMIVLASSTCSFCQKYKPVIEEIKKEYDFEINYIDLKADNSILKEDITIPARCSTFGRDSKINEGFGTPLSLFMQGNEVIDCIRGYTTKENVVNKINQVIKK